MKKFGLYAVVSLLVTVFLSGCALVDGVKKQTYVEKKLENNIALPFYDTLTSQQKEGYEKVCDAIESFNTNDIVVGRYDSEKECYQASKEWNFIYRDLVYEQPEFFWINPHECEMSIYQFKDEYQLRLKLQYLLDEDSAMEKKQIFDRRVEEIVTTAESEVTLFEKLLCVYDMILKNASYDTELADSLDVNKTDIRQSAYGCLIEGKTVCSGYALSFNLIMQKLGIESGVEFNSYNEISIFEGHVWNYCKLDGEYYYFDLTWDDSGFDADEYKPYMEYSYCYFGITKEELEKSTYNISDDAKTPPCTGTRYNYFVYNNMYFPQYNYEIVKNSILEQSGNNYIVLKFSDYSELLSAEIDLITKQKIFELLPNVEEISYVESESNLHLYIFYK